MKTKKIPLSPFQKALRKMKGIDEPSPTKPLSTTPAPVEPVPEPWQNPLRQIYDDSNRLYNEYHPDLIPASPDELEKEWEEAIGNDPVYLGQLLGSYERNAQWEAATVRRRREAFPYESPDNYQQAETRAVDYADKMEGLRGKVQSLVEEVSHKIDMKLVVELARDGQEGPLADYLIEQASELGVDVDQAEALKAANLAIAHRNAADSYYVQDWTKEAANAVKVFLWKMFLKAKGGQKSLRKTKTGLDKVPGQNYFTDPPQPPQDALESVSPELAVSPVNETEAVGNDLGQVEPSYDEVQPLQIIEARKIPDAGWDIRTVIALAHDEAEEPLKDYLIEASERMGVPDDNDAVRHLIDRTVWLLTQEGNSPSVIKSDLRYLETRLREIIRMERQSNKSLKTKHCGHCISSVPEEVDDIVAWANDTIPSFHLAPEQEEPFIPITDGIPDEALEAIQGMLTRNGPVEGTLGEPMLLDEVDGAVPLVVEIDSPELEQLQRSILDGYGVTQDKEFSQRFVKLANLTPAMAKHYRDIPFPLKGKKISLKSVCFSKGTTKRKVPLTWGKGINEGDPIPAPEPVAEIPPPEKPKRTVLDVYRDFDDVYKTRYNDPPSYDRMVNQRPSPRQSITDMANMTEGMAQRVAELKEGLQEPNENWREQSQSLHNRYHPILQKLVPHMNEAASLYFEPLIQETGFDGREVADMVADAVNEPFPEEDEDWTKAGTWSILHDYLTEYVQTSEVTDPLGRDTENIVREFMDAMKRRADHAQKLNVPVQTYIYGMIAAFMNNTQGNRLGSKALSGLNTSGGKNYKERRSKLEVSPKEVERLLRPWDGSLIWDNDDIHKLDLPAKTIPIHKLTWYLDMPCWSPDGVPSNKPDGKPGVRPKDVFDNPGIFPEHDKRIDEADTSYPLDLLKHNGKLFILDGLHRLLKLMKEDKKEVQVRIVPQSDFDRIEKETRDTINKEASMTVGKALKRTLPTDRYAPPSQRKRPTKPKPLHDAYAVNKAMEEDDSPEVEPVRENPPVSTRKPLPPVLDSRRITVPGPETERRPPQDYGTRTEANMPDNDPGGMTDQRIADPTPDLDVIKLDERDLVVPVEAAPPPEREPGYIPDPEIDATPMGAKTQELVMKEYKKELLAIGGITSTEPQPVLDTPQTIESLKTQDVVGVEPMARQGITSSFRVKLADNTEGVFKPAIGQSAFIVFPPGDHEEQIREGITNGLWVREAVAYDVAEMMGLGKFIPPTVIREIAGRKGSLQKYRGDALIARELADPHRYDSPEGTATTAFFYFLIGNTDQHTGNWMLTDDDEYVWIDHGLSFPDYEGKPYPADGLSGWAARVLHRAGDYAYPIPDELKANIRKNLPMIREKLKEAKIPDGAIEGLIRRAKMLMEETTFKTLLDRIWAETRGI